MLTHNSSQKMQISTKLCMWNESRITGEISTNWKRVSGSAIKLCKELFFLSSLRFECFMHTHTYTQHIKHGSHSKNKFASHIGELIHWVFMHTVWWSRVINIIILLLNICRNTRFCCCDSLKSTIYTLDWIWRFKCKNNTWILLDYWCSPF